MFFCFPDLFWWKLFKPIGLPSGINISEPCWSHLYLWSALGLCKDLSNLIFSLHWQKIRNRWWRKIRAWLGSHHVSCHPRSQVFLSEPCTFNVVALVWPGQLFSALAHCREGQNISMQPADTHSYSWRSSFRANMSLPHGELKAWEECLSGELLANPTNLTLLLRPSVKDLRFLLSLDCLLCAQHMFPPEINQGWCVPCGHPGRCCREEQGLAGLLSFRVMPKHWSQIPVLSRMPPACFPHQRELSKGRFVCLTLACGQLERDLSLALYG